MDITRRGFCLGATAAFAAAATARVGTTTVGSLDPEAIGFISDIHVGLPLARQKYKTMRDYPHQPAASQALVREILALPHPPANVLCLGDISLAFGETEDYAIAAETLKPLMDAGIKVTCAMGNHDIRAEFLKYFPGYDKTTQVPGRFVSVEGAGQLRRLHEEGAWQGTARVASRDGCRRHTPRLPVRPPSGPRTRHPHVRFQEPDRARLSARTHAPVDDGLPARRFRRQRAHAAGGRHSHARI